MSIKLQLLLLLQLACLTVLVLGRKQLRCKPPEIKFCNACRHVDVVSNVAFKKCDKGYKLIDGFCQTTTRTGRARDRKCLRDEVKLATGGCRKKKKSLKRCSEISKDLVKLMPICDPGQRPNGKCRKAR